MASEISSQNKIEYPFAIKWIIAEEKLAALKDSRNGYLKTDDFYAMNLPGVHYYFKIYPNGDVDEDRGNVGMFLHLELGHQKKIKADYKFMIESAGFVKDYENEFDENYGWGEEKCCTTAELFDQRRKFIVDGRLTIKCEGILTVEKEKMSRKRKWKETTLGHQLWEGNNKDFSIMVEGKPIQVHKCVLADRSPVFQDLFNSDMKEIAQSKMNITDFSFKCVETSLQLLYDRKISDLTLEEKAEVLQFFDKYKIHNLKINLIKTSLMDDISASTVCNIANASLVLNSIQLQNKCIDFLVNCSKNGIFVKDFDELDKDFALKIFKITFYKTTKT